MTLGEFAAMAPSADGPARDLVAITFDQDEVVTNGRVLRGIYNGNAAAKDIAIIKMDGNSTIIKNVPSGSLYPVFCRGVATTGTAALATDLLGNI